jgi:hypothetical protein
MGDEQCTGRRISFRLAADQSALLVVERLRALQTGIATWQPNDLQSTACGSCLDKAKRI